MASRRLSNFFSLFLLSIFICESEEYKKLKSAETIHDNIEPPVIYPSPPNIPAPPVVNIPPPVPLVTVIPDPTATPVVNPTATPVPLPSSNPASSSPPLSTNPVTQPVMPPPAIPNPPINTGRGWCVAKSGVQQAALQAALDYACGAGGVDCSVLQQGGSCYNPVTLDNHASYAFNSYYQSNPVPTSCDFGGTAVIVSTNPSSGSCIFPTSSSTSTSSVPPPASQTPTLTPPTPPIVPTPPPAVPTPPAFSTPPSAPTLPAASTPPALFTPPAPPTLPAAPTPPASLRPPAYPSPIVSSPGTTVPRASGYPVSVNSTNNSTAEFPMGGFPNIFPIVNTSIPPDSPPSVTSLSNPSSLPRPFIGGVILLTSIVTWSHILDL